MTQQVLPENPESPASKRSTIHTKEKSPLRSPLRDSLRRIVFSPLVRRKNRKTSKSDNTSKVTKTRRRNKSLKGLPLPIGLYDDDDVATQDSSASTSTASTSASTVELVEQAIEQIASLPSSLDLKQDGENGEDVDSSSSRKIRFALSKNQIIPAESNPITEEEKSNAWWTVEEYEEAAMALHLSIHDCHRQHPDSILDLVHVVGLCNLSASDTLEDHEDAVSSLVDASCTRGFEPDVAPILKAGRRKHCSAVLEYVNKIPKHLPSDLRDRMLSARSMQYSRPHKILSTILGEVDRRMTVGEEE